MPGVSRKTTCASGSVRMPRMRLRVVCGLGVTMATLAPTSAFSSVDLPTFGRPTMAAYPARWAILGGCPSSHGGCGERSGGCERRARSSLLRRAFRHASSVVAALAALTPRLVRLARHGYPERLLRARLGEDDLEGLVLVAVPEAGDRVAERHARRELGRKGRRDRRQLPHLRVGDPPVHHEGAVLEAELEVVVGHLGREPELVGERRGREAARELEAQDVGVVAVDDLVDRAVAAVALELLVEVVPVAVEAVEADAARRAARAREQDDQAAERPHQRRVEGAADRRLAEGDAAEEALAHSERGLGESEREAEEDPLVDPQAEEVYASGAHRERQDHDRVEHQVQKDVGRSGELGVEEAAVGDGRVDALL